MIPILCSQGHHNAPENRFCPVCGEKLPMAQLGAVLGNRYQIVRQLGSGSFGRTYLAEDINRFNEPCVLKEFAPQVEGDEALQKAEDLFEHEAGILYKLQHPQIPRFRELFRATLAERDRLFLVQDYVEGYTYQQLLEARKLQGICFSEIEVRQLLMQILPVLQYLHTVGVIHRDISPNNLILRSVDQQPVLVDFGGVKQIAATATSKYTDTAPTAVTRLGKIGYAPEAQISEGIVSPQSDLYALAMTALVLLTGKEPLELVDPGGNFRWQEIVSLSPELTTVLTRMLSTQSSQQFSSAEAVLQSLPFLPVHEFNVPSVAASSGAVNRSITSATVPISPVAAPIAQTPETPELYQTPAVRVKRRSHWPITLLLLISLLGIASGAWWWRDRWLPVLSQLWSQLLSQPSLVAPSPDNSLESRAKAAEVDFAFLVKLTNATFYERYPEQQGRSLSEGDADAALRQIWAEIANEWLDRLQQLSPEARRNLGNFTEADRNQWKQTVNQLYVGSRALYDLTDAQFFEWFPQQQDQEFLDQPIGQVWQAIAFDQVQALKTGKILERIEFEPGEFSTRKSSNLASGAGRVYIANLAADQIMRLNLQAAESRLSIYLPRPTKEQPVLLEDSTEATWTGTLPQSGYYEIVIVNPTSQPISYQLNLAVDNVTSTPIQPQQGEAPEAKD